MEKTFSEILNEHIKDETPTVFNDFYSNSTESECLSLLISSGFCINILLKNTYFKLKPLYRAPVSETYPLNSNQKNALDFINSMLMSDEKLIGQFTNSQLKKAFRRLAKRNHPDLGGSNHNFRQVTEQFKILLDFFHSFR